MPVGDTLHFGQVSSYDASLRTWNIKFPTRTPTTSTYSADDMARYGPPNTTCPPQPGTSEHTIAAYLHGRTPGPAAWFASAPRISPYDPALFVLSRFSGVFSDMGVQKHCKKRFAKKSCRKAFTKKSTQQSMSVFPQLPLFFRDGSSKTLSK
jgi:hypothetical protein